MMLFEYTDTRGDLKRIDAIDPISAGRAIFKTEVVTHATLSAPEGMHYIRPLAGESGGYILTLRELVDERRKGWSYGTRVFVGCIAMLIAVIAFITAFIKP
jgi:hypothetical protein